MGDRLFTLLRLQRRAERSRDRWTFLARSHWGGACNGELKQLMLRHAFRFVDSVVFFVSPGNIRSQQSVSRIGGILEPDRDATGRSSTA